MLEIFAFFLPGPLEIVAIATMVIVVPAALFFLVRAAVRSANRQK
jgi:hypothetical protein